MRAPQGSCEARGRVALRQEVAVSMPGGVAAVQRSAGLPASLRSAEHGLHLRPASAGLFSGDASWTTLMQCGQDPACGCLGGACALCVSRV